MPSYDRIRLSLQSRRLVKLWENSWSTNTTALSSTEPQGRPDIESPGNRQKYTIAVNVSARRKTCITGRTPTRISAKSAAVTILQIRTKPTGQRILQIEVGL